MIQGTTPTHIFYIKFETSLIKKISIIYVQNDETILLKKENDVILKDKEISFKLTQEETLKFKENDLVNIQLKIKTISDDVYVSDIIVSDIKEVLDKEIF